MIEKIREEVEALGREFEVTTLENEKMNVLMSYSFRSDVISYNPYLIERRYEELYKRHVNLHTAIMHHFGHELAHREKFLNCTEEEKETAGVLLEIFRNPREAMRSFPEDKMLEFPFYRAVSIANVLFEEHYAERNNPFSSSKVSLLDARRISEITRKNMKNVVKVVHSLPYSPPHLVKACFLSPLVVLPPNFLKIFPTPEYITLRKIKLFLEKIRTVRDVFDEEKMNKVAEVILYEL